MLLALLIFLIVAITVPERFAQAVLVVLSVVVPSLLITAVVYGGPPLQSFALGALVPNLMVLFYVATSLNTSLHWETFGVYEDVPGDIFSMHYPIEHLRHMIAAALAVGTGVGLLTNGYAILLRRWTGRA